MTLKISLEKQNFYQNTKQEMLLAISIHFLLIVIIVLYNHYYCNKKRIKNVLSSIILRIDYSGRLCVICKASVFIIRI